MKAARETTLGKEADHKQIHVHKENKQTIVHIIPVKTQGISGFAFLISVYFVSVTDFIN